MMLLKCSKMMSTRTMSAKMTVNDVRNDVDDDAEEDDGYVEVEFDVVNP